MICSFFTKQELSFNNNLNFKVRVWFVAKFDFLAFKSFYVGLHQDPQSFQWNILPKKVRFHNILQFSMLDVQEVSPTCGTSTLALGSSLVSFFARFPSLFRILASQVWKVEPPSSLSFLDLLSCFLILNLQNKDSFPNLNSFLLMLRIFFSSKR